MKNCCVLFKCSWNIVELSDIIFQYIMVIEKLPIFYVLCEFSISEYILNLIQSMDAWYSFDYNRKCFETLRIAKWYDLFLHVEIKWSDNHTELGNIRLYRTLRLTQQSFKWWYRKLLFNYAYPYQVYARCFINWVTLNLVHLNTRHWIWAWKLISSHKLS